MKEATPVKRIRHFFHGPSTGWDQVMSFAEHSTDPCFAWSEFALPGGLDLSNLHICSVTTVGNLRRVAARWMAGNEADLSVYHDGYAADLLARIDGAERKTMFLHRRTRFWVRHVEYFVRFGVGLFYDQNWGLEEFKTKVPWIPERFLYPQNSPWGFEKERTIKERKPFICGIYIPAEFEKSFRNRLRASIDALVRSHPDWAFQVLVFGQLTSRLARQNWLKEDRLTFTPLVDYKDVNAEVRKWDAWLQLETRLPLTPLTLAAAKRGCYLLIPQVEEGAVPAFEEVGAPQAYEECEFLQAGELLDGWGMLSLQEKERYRDWASQICPEENQLEWLAKKEKILETISAQRRLNFNKRAAFPNFWRLSWYMKKCRLRSEGQF